MLCGFSQDKAKVQEPGKRDQRSQRQLSMDGLDRAADQS